MAFGYGYNTSAYDAVPYNGTSDLIHAGINVTQQSQLSIADAYVYVGIGENQTQNDNFLFSEVKAFLAFNLSVNQENQSISADVIRIVTLDLSNIQDDNSCHICAYTGIARNKDRINGIAKHNLSAGISYHSNNASVNKINRSC